MNALWQPTASLVNIKQRAELLNNIRKFFNTRSVLEVETPLLCQYAPTMPYIDPIVVNMKSGRAINRFLQSSPEYAMKRLVAYGSGDIFQICKAFRGQEQGKLHNPEFTMLEWYRVNFNHHQLIQETIELLQYCGINYAISKNAYREIFYKYLNLDPVLADLSTMQQFIYNNITLSSQGVDFIKSASKQECQEMLFSHVVESSLAHNTINVVYNYPKEQAALAKIIIDNDNIEVAARFEVYINGLEVANGFYELADPIVQRTRFVKDQNVRKKLRKPYLEIDPYFMSALEQGLPECSGVALGVDRLLMLKTLASSIEEVISFPWDIA